jgi:hypothetical protein
MVAIPIRHRRDVDTDNLTLYKVAVVNIDLSWEPESCGLGAFFF